MHSTGIEFRSLGDLSTTVLSGMWKLPRDIDLVVGVPRSGMLPATLIATALGAPLVDLQGFIAGRVFQSGRREPAISKNIRKVLVVDDSVATGAANQLIREQLASIATSDSPELILAAVYVEEATKDLVDFYFEEISGPRIFEWNLTNHYLLPSCCVDIDGVLCCDPTSEQNDDGDCYRDFMFNAVPNLRFRKRIGWLVTNRLERFRPETEHWLAKQGIEYGELIMLDLPSKAERQRNGPHGRYKAEVYRRLPASLFIESEYDQARFIVHATGKPVLCTSPMQLLYPNNSEKLAGKLKRSPLSLSRRAKNIARAALEWAGVRKQGQKTAK
jgi:uncharacterized HAD superfamily protein